MPVILVDHEVEEDTFASVSVDDVEGGRLAAAHLLQAGRRRLAFVGGPRSLNQVADRLKGARIAVAEFPDATLEVIERPSLTVLQGRGAGEEIVARAAADRLADALRRVALPEVVVLLVVGDPSDRIYQDEALGLTANGSVTGYLSLNVWPSPENLDRLVRGEVREIIEMQMARTAAEIATPEAIMRIRQALADQEAALDSPSEFMERDGKFHLEIANASSNPIAVELVGSMFSWLQAFHAQWVRRPGLGPLTLSEHRAVLRAIEEGDVEGAALSMKTHLNRANSQYATGNRKVPAATS